MRARSIIQIGAVLMGLFSTASIGRADGYEVTVSGARLRSKPSLTGTRGVTEILPLGTPVSVLKRVKVRNLGTWYFVKGKNKAGWVNSRLLAKAKLRSTNLKRTAVPQSKTRVLRGTGEPTDVPRQTPLELRPATVKTESVPMEPPPGDRFVSVPAAPSDDGKRCQAIKDELIRTEVQEIKLGRSTRRSTFQGIPRNAKDKDLLPMCDEASNFCIYRSFGGYIDEFRAFGARLRKAGCNIVVLGSCNSACSGFLVSAFPRNQVCVGPKASLGFHKAYFDKRFTENVKVTSVVGTQVLASAFHSDPDPLKDQTPLKNWFIENVQNATEDGQADAMKKLSGKDLAKLGFGNMCGAPPAPAPSALPPTTQPFLDTAGAAAATR